jgi:peptide/nickel transport system ATP-binding protein
MPSIRKTLVSEAPALEIRHLGVEFLMQGEWRAAVRGLNLSIDRNETLAVVGESGSGKSLSALSVMGLIPANGRIAPGSSIRLDGQELVGLGERRWDAVRGRRVAMIFQEPMTALNPTMTVGRQVTEAVRAHRACSASQAQAEAQRMLDLVKVPSAARRMHDYPHQFSGGMRQRVMIAIALACQPRVLLADEPTTALDVTLQAQVLALIEELKREYGLAVMFITHNLGVVALIADRVAVMYAGEVVETAGVHELFSSPRHPYSRALLESVPRVDRPARALDPIPGNVPAPGEVGAGCAFAPRCRHSLEICRIQAPAWHAVEGGTSVRCWLEEHSS